MFERFHVKHHVGPFFDVLEKIINVSRETYGKIRENYNMFHVKH